ncbi:5-formyltetrahydrofolate cyclo-ligase [Desertibaculum subflavum]|uniref:5-formyltetrahydrofolate cyclo-ligase n=1 Tax=Desertibaculum subflavum TaxID=2268458 RepID=UPI000E660F9F
MNESAATKRALRASLRVRRKAAAAADPAAAERLAQIFLSHLSLAAGAVVAGYSAVPPELDPAPLMTALAAGGHPLALPCTGPLGTVLVFRSWQPGDPLVKGALGIEEPRPEAPSVLPSVALVPLLGFDRRGHRLGQGGGYYDRTLAAGTMLAIGLAYAAQEVEVLPVEPWDRRLDWIVTEREAIRA